MKRKILTFVLVASFLVPLATAQPALADKDKGGKTKPAPTPRPKPGPRDDGDDD